MTKHLSPEELIDALDGGLDADRAAHLTTCAACSGQLADLRAAVQSAADAGEAPEPSPLYWDVMANRVRAATAAEPVRSANRAWKPVVALGAMAATALLAVLLRAPSPAPETNTVVAPSVTIAESTPAEDDSAWDLVISMAATLSHEQLHEIAPASPATAVLVEELTPSEREAFVKLIQREMSGLE